MSYRPRLLFVIVMGALSVASQAQAQERAPRGDLVRSAHGYVLPSPAMAPALPPVVRPALGALPLSGVRPATPAAVPSLTGATWVAGDDIVNIGLSRAASADGRKQIPTPPTRAVSP